MICPGNHHEYGKLRVYSRVNIQYLTEYVLNMIPVRSSNFCVYIYIYIIYQCRPASVDDCTSGRSSRRMLLLLLLQWGFGVAGIWEIIFPSLCMLHIGKQYIYIYIFIYYIGAWHISW